MINSHILISGTKYFDDKAAINPFMDASVIVDVERAADEHAELVRAFGQAGIQITQVEPPEGCQDGVYTANWALVRGDTAVMSRLPNARKGEEAYAENILRSLGKQIIHMPETIRFSGQGDALPCGNYLFAGSSYRTDPAAHSFLAETLGYEVISLQTVPVLDQTGAPAVNTYSGWPDSFFYDIDLALAVLRAPEDGQRGLVAWCPDAFVPESRERLAGFGAVEKVEVSLQEAKEAFACNLVSTGKTVVMSSRAPQLKDKFVRRGFEVITPVITELAKGGGYIRCTSLTLSNK